MTPQQRKTIFIIAAVVLIALNFYTFIVAYPETYTPSLGITTLGINLAKDFSAYYIGAWRLWHNPSQIYHFGALGGAEPVTPPHPEAYKYLPSFLLFISPLLTVNYQQALHFSTLHSLCFCLQWHICSTSYWAVGILQSTSSYW